MKYNGHKIEENSCSWCEWNRQGKHSMHCSHPNKITYIELDKPCSSCRRKPDKHKPSCGACIGRGLYTYPFVYDECDCGGWELKKYIKKELNHKTSI